MKLPSKCLMIAAISMMALPINAQQPRESADPYFQPKGTPPSSKTQNQPLQGFGANNKSPTSKASTFQPSGQPSVARSATSQNSSFQPASPTIPNNGPGSFQPSSSVAGGGSFGVSNQKQPTTRPAFEPKASTSQQSASPAKQLNSTQEIVQVSFEPTRVLARVGGEPIFFGDLSVEAMQLVDKFMGQAPASVKQREMKNLIPRLLPKYIQSKLLLVDAIDGLPEGANLDDIYDSAGKQFDEMMVPELLKNVKVATPLELDAYYRQLGSSLRSVRKSWIESELVKYMMRSKINIDPDVTHREMYEHYLANKDKYSVPAKARWEQLMVRFDKFQSRDAARAAITEMGNEVVYGAPLTAVAKRSSQGYKSQEGGQQGWTTRGSLVDKDLDRLLFTMEPGKLSEVIETSRGYAIIRVQERTDAGFVPFETAQAEIKKKIASTKQEKEFQDYISKVKARIPVEVFEPEMVARNPENKIR